MLTRREDKYTSALPRCTCLPPRQHCAGVALGSPPPTPQHCWFGRRTSTTRLRLVVLASSSSTMLWSCTRCPPDSNAVLIRLVVPGLGGLEWSLWWPPRTTSAQVHRGQVQVQLGFASLYLDLALVDLSGVGGGLPRATPAELPQLDLSYLSQGRWGTPPLLCDLYQGKILYFDIVCLI